MLVSLNWLKDFVKVPDNFPPQELADQLTTKTAEVEKVFSEAEAFENMVVGHVSSVKPHPNADKLKIAMTNIGGEEIQIVCGGANLKEGMYVAVAKIGARVKWHGEGDLVTMEKTKIRGEVSFGMICAGSEIGVNDSNEGPHDILDLNELKPTAGTPLAELFKKNDVILEFDNKTLTHRPDLWGHYGIAREVATLTKQELKPLSPKVAIPTSGEQVDVKVQSPKTCPRYCGLIIENVKIEESPAWLQKRLKTIGHGTHNNIVDVTNYVMAELGQPMHAFDKGFIEGGIVVRNAEPHETITALDDNEHKLTKEDLVIADHKKPVAIAGVIGGKGSGINEKTTSIILESANFHAATVRKTSTRLGVRTDSVQRFEKSLDPVMAETAIKRAAELVLQLCPKAKIAGPITDVSNFDTTKKVIKLDLSRLTSKAGVDIPKERTIEILESLEFKVKRADEKELEVEVPSFRATKDVTAEDDLIEEVVRVFGYDAIPAILPHLPTVLPTANNERLQKHQTRNLFSLGLGFNEVYNYSFYGNSEMERCLMSEESHLLVENYLSEDQTHLRTTLVPNLLKDLQFNVKQFEDLKLYEIGRTYKEIGEFHPLEEKFLCGAILYKGDNDQVFYESKGAVEAFLNQFKLKTKVVKEVKNTPVAHPNKAISFLLKNGETVAKTYILHPVVQKNHDLEGYSIAIFEINLTAAFNAPQAELKYQAIPKFPSTSFDVSVTVDKNLEVGALKKAILSANQNLIESVKLFDLYEGPNLPEDKKATAFTITLRAPDRTLENEEIVETQQKVFKNLEDLGGTIRGR